MKFFSLLLACYVSLFAAGALAAPEKASSDADLEHQIRRILKEHPDIVLDVLREHSETALDIVQLGADPPYGNPAQPMERGRQAAQEGQP